MPPIPPLFTLPIEPSGSITCTQPSPKVYLLTFSSQPDNRFTESFCKAFQLALDIIAHRYPKGVVVSTSGIAKFYSNGLDYETAIRTKGFFRDTLYPLWKRLLTYPMPTIALINGHAFAGGLMTAMMHDYRIMNPHRGFVCVNELEFGAPLPAPMAAIFRQKVPNPNTYRSMVLEAKRFNALEALKEGIVDGLGGLEETVVLIRELRLEGKPKSGVYGILKAEMWRETLGYLEEADVDDRRMEASVENQSKAEKLEREKVETWERGQIRNSKL